MCSLLSGDSCDQPLCLLFVFLHDDAAHAEVSSDDSDSDDGVSRTVWDLPAAIISPSPHTLFARRITVKLTVPRTAVVRGVELHTSQQEMPRCC